MDEIEGEQLPSGLVPDQAVSYAAAFTKSLSVDNERWAKAELRTAEIIEKIQPTRASEERRKAVAEFVRNLICDCFPGTPCKVFTFGSVPLLTYLPDGDIDLTIVSQDPSLKDTWANIVRSTLERTERNQDAAFRVRDIQYIHAEVKLIKCVVENIIVDISFNQLGGLCTLCFLDEVDLIIRQNHFFKRSIILVKAWCYYESAILGAHHGLISTYALETLVLYIFHVFHTSIRGPLEVLLRFLEFFSKFDWHRHCVSLWGPVPIATLPEMAAESPRKDGGDLLLSHAFLKECGEAYAVFPPGQDNQQRSFNPKYLNVVDPLRPGNNLGRSVSQTNYNRIVGTFGKSGDKLLKILLDTSKDIVEHLDDRRKGFFKRIRRKLDALEERRPDAPGFIHRRLSNGVGVNLPNGYGSNTAKAHENGDSMRSYGAETYYVDRRYQSKPLGWVSDFDTRTQTMARVAQMVGSQASIAPSVLVYGAFDSNMEKCSEAETPQENGHHTTSSNGKTNHLQASQSVPVERKGVPHRTESFEKLRRHHRKGSSDQSNGDVPEDGVTGYRQWGDARDLASVDLDGGGQGDVKPSHDESALKASALTGSRSDQVHFTSASIQASSAVESQGVGLDPVRGNGYFTSDDSFEGSSSPSMSSTQSSFDRDVSRHGGWAAEQSGYRETGTVDTHNQLKMQDAGSRGSAVPLPLPLIPPSFVQMQPHPLTHPGTLPLHLATSITTSSSIGHPPLTLTAPPPPPLSLHSVHPSSILGDSSLGLGPRAGPYYGMHLPRGPPAPPLPPTYFPGPPFVHSGGDTSNIVGSRGSGFVDDKFLEQQQREVWQQMELLQVHDHLQNQHCGHRPTSSGGTSASSASHQTDSDSSLTSLVSRHQVTVGHLSSSKSHDISSSCDLLDDARAEQNGKAWTDDADNGNSVTEREVFVHMTPEERGTGNKIPRSSRDKRGQVTLKGSSVEEAVDSTKSGDVLTSPRSRAESVARWPTQGAGEELATSTQGYPQLVRTPASVVYPNLLPSSVPGPVNTEMSSFLPPPLLLPHRNSGANLPISNPSLTQATPASVNYPVSATGSFRPPVSDPTSGTVTSGSSQRSRPVETGAIHPPYYTPGSHFFPSIYVPMYYNMDFLSGFQLIDNSSESTVSQAADSSRSKCAQQVGAGVGEKLKSLGIAACAGTKMQQTVLESYPNDRCELSEGSYDLLSSDFHEHLQNLEVARWCQRSPIHAYAQPSYPTPPVKYHSSYRPWEGPGRPVVPNMNMLNNGISHGHGVVPGSHSVSSSGRNAGNYHRSYTGPVNHGSEEQAKVHGATGTYSPTPRSGYHRDRQPFGGSRQYGGYNQDRNERVDREGHQGYTHYRYRNSNRGQNKYDTRSQSSDRSNFDLKGGERGRDGQRNQDGFRRVSGGTVTTSNSGHGTAPILPGGAALSQGKYAAPTVASTNKLTSGLAGPTSPLAHSCDKKGGSSPESVEFGSLGPVPAGTNSGGNEVDPGTSPTPSVSGSSPSSGEKSMNGPSSPGLRVMQRTYLLKEEDFPPLTFTGQKRGSSTGFTRGSTGGRTVSSSPPCVVVPSS